MSTMLSIQAEYPEDSAGFSTLMFRASLGDYCVVRDKELYSVTSAATILSDLLTSLAAPPPLKGTLSYATSSASHTPEDVLIFAVILIASLRVIILKQMVAQFFSHVLRAINCDRRAHSPSFSIHGMKRNVIKPNAFSNLTPMMDAVEEMKSISTWMLSFDVLGVNAERDDLFQESLTVHTMVIDLCILCSNKIARIGLERRDCEANPFSRPPISNVGGKMLSYLQTLDADQALYISIREEAWKLYDAWRLLFRDAMASLSNISSKDSNKDKLVLVTLRRQLIRMRIQTLATTASKCILLEQLTIEEDADVEIEDEGDPRKAQERVAMESKQKKEGLEVLTSMDSEYYRMFQIVGVRGFVQTESEAMMKELHATKTGEEVGRLTMQTRNLAMYLMNLQTHIERLIADNVTCCTTPTNTQQGKSITRFDMLTNYLNAIEKSFDLCLTMIQVITQTCVRDADDIDYGIDGSGNRYRTVGSGLRAWYAKEKIIPGLHEPLKNVLRSFDMKAMHQLVSESPLLVNSGTAAAKKKIISCEECRSWLFQPMNANSAFLESQHKELETALQKVGQDWLKTYQQTKLKDETSQLHSIGDVKNKCDENTMILFKMIWVENGH
jgi:hypothetical protein